MQQLSNVNRHMNRGQSLIELLIVMALMALLLPTLTGALITSREGKPQQEQRMKAAQKLQEMAEGLKSIREDNWNNIAANGIYHVENNGIGWTLPSGPVTIDGITSQVEIRDVRRDDVSNTIVSSGGYIDPSTKQAIITVSWSQPLSGSITSSLYLTRYLDNRTYIQTTGGSPGDDFNMGTIVDVAITHTDDGEIILGSGGHGDWCNPQDYIVGQMNLAQSGQARSIAAIEGKAFTGTDTFFSGTFYSINISNDSPPNFSVAGTLPGYSTNDIFIDGNYAYVAVDDPFNYYNRDVIIVDLTSNTIVGYFNTGSWIGGSGVFVSGNIGYVTTGNYLRSFDLSQKTGSRPQLDSTRLETSLLADLVVRGKKVYIVGNYAYVALSGWISVSNELRLVNISDPTELARAARADVNGSNGQQVFVNATGTRAYLATGASGSQDEFFVINTDPAEITIGNKNNTNYNLPVKGSYNANGMDPRGVIAVPGNRALLVGTGGEEYQTLNLNDETHPVRCGGMQVDSGIYGVAAVLEADGDAYSYIVTNDPSNEFKALLGGPGGSYADSGYYESATFPPGYSTAFNRLFPNTVLPIGTHVSYQIAVADPPSGNCDDASFVFTGPNGQSDTFYTGESNIFFDNNDIGYENPGRCFRYRTYLSTDESSSTPIFEDMTVNYSP